MGSAYNRHDYYRLVAAAHAGYVAAKRNEPYDSCMCQAWRRGWVAYNLDLLKQHGCVLLMQHQSIVVDAIDDNANCTRNATQRRNLTDIF